MSEVFESLPNEILIHIFTFVKPKQLAQCSLVCKRWKLIIDSFSCKDKFWLRNCKTDFPNVYMSAYNKRLPGLSWYNIYRSLTLWPNLNQAEELRDEFASSSRFIDEIRDFHILGDGTIGIQTRVAINFYDLETLKPTKRPSISGNFLRYVEDENTIIVHGCNLNLHVVRKRVGNIHYDPEITFPDIKLFLLADHELFLVSSNDELCLCKLNEMKLKMTELCCSPSSIMSVGFSKGRLHILTSRTEIFTVVGQTLVYQKTLGYSNYYYHDIKSYNFFENMDWRVHFEWRRLLRQPVPLGPWCDIVAVKDYGEIVFVGSNWGVLRIYYSPYLSGHFDILNSMAMRQINFTERHGDSVPSECPILKIDVVEREDGHMILVAMSKKIAVLKYKHNFENIKPNISIQYTNVQRVVL